MLRSTRQGRWWYQALEDSGLDDQFKYAYAVISRDGIPIGIAPTFLMNVPIDVVAPEVAPVLNVIGKVVPAVLYQRTLFVGSVCADEGTIGLIPEVVFSQVVDVLQQAVELKAKELKAVMLVWKDFPDAYKPDLSKMAKERGFFELVSFPGTVVKLADNKKDSYYANLKGSRRHNLKKKLKHSKQMIDLTAQVINRPDEATLDEVFPLFWQTYEKGKTKFEKLTRKFFSVIANLDSSYFVVLREASTKQMVAFMLCFKIGDRIINKFIGIDYTKPPKWHLYFRLWDAALDWVLTTGAKEFQSGQTGYRAKIDVGHSLVALTNYCRHSNPLIHRIYAFVGGKITWSSLDEDLKVFLAAHPEEEQLLKR